MVPTIERNADFYVVALDMFKNIVGKTLCCHAYRILVHPVCTYAHDSTKAAGTELQVPITSIFKFNRIIIAKLDDLAFGFGVKIPHNPTVSNFSEISFHIA